MIRRSGVALVAGLVVTAVVSPGAVAGQAIEILNRDIKDVEAQLQFFLALLRTEAEQRVAALPK
ncbi:MAG TPA: hypothetical protein VKQ05_09825 [Gemmatimonadales bacterium]|nr:hypothetical protein [Gemmatimonadales bacterium]